MAVAVSKLVPEMASFCEKFGLRLKAITEIQKLRQQLHRESKRHAFLKKKKKHNHFVTYNSG